MTKQEFLAMSLPYGLKYKYLNGTFSLFDYACYSKVEKYDSIYSIILHPLSDITNEIEHKGDKIHVLTFLCEKYRSLDPHQLIAAIKFGIVEFNIMIDLIKLHFDVAGLIEKGEAIDVNSLDVNPYK